MQDKYAGDIGDFGKFALLRALGAGRRLGVCWFKTDGAGDPVGDGRHLDYLDKSEKFRHIDRALFDALRDFKTKFESDSAHRTIENLERLNLVPTATIFHDNLCPRVNANHPLRAYWGVRMIQAVGAADLAFADPDNGIETVNCRNKNILLREINALAAGRPLITYHHQTRFKGGAPAEFSHLRNRLLALDSVSKVSGIRLSAYSCRFYLLINGDDELESKLNEFCGRWGRQGERFS